ncbi:MAG: hypothetical protein HY231_10150 [Acidobacteria bacterium]|nr:hypothetical protein [Acidobacteriota bacterium]
MRLPSSKVANKVLLPAPHSGGDRSGNLSEIFMVVTTVDGALSVTNSGDGRRGSLLQFDRILGYP